MKIPYPKRMKISVLTGAFLGVFCIIGVGSRIGYTGNELYLLGMWYNRVIMGLIVGLSKDIILIDNNRNNTVLRGLIIGTLVTTAIFLSTSFKDIPSYFAGVAYGIIIDYVSTRYS
jgi:hypothetical protein